MNTTCKERCFYGLCLVFWYVESVADNVKSEFSDGCKDHPVDGVKQVNVSEDVKQVARVVPEAYAKDGIAKESGDEF